MRPSRAALAASCWVAAGVTYLAAELVAAAAFPGYSYAENYISDLGVPADSPAHLVMNTGFVLHGALFAAAALLTASASDAAYRRGFIALAVATGAGNLVVGLVHSGQAGAAWGVVHGVGAAMAIVGGNLTAIVGGRSLRRCTSRHHLGAVCVALGSVGLLATAGLAVDGGASSVDVLAAGAWERLAVYAITGFELTLGAALLLRRRA